MIPYYPFLVVIVAYGTYKLWQHGPSVVVLILMIANPIVASIRILPERWMNRDKHIPMALYNEDTRDQLSNNVPQNALCIVGEDDSHCIYFYFLHKKGFGYDSWQSLVETQNAKSEPIIKDYINKGATYLYLSSSDASDAMVAEKALAPYLDKRIDSVGSICVYKLKR